jgi:zinc protease
VTAAGTPGLTRTRLANGLTVLVQEHGAAAVAAVQVWVGVGARHETPEVAGVSHFLEHLLFKGTPTRGPGVIDDTIAELGGDMNAATSQDFTCFHVVLPDRHLATAVDVLADAARRATLEAEELERERLVVLEEIRRAEDDPQSELWRLLAGRHYEAHPYGRPVLGTMDSIAGVSRAAVQAYYREHYVPEKTTVVVAGRVPAAEAVAVVARHFDGWAGAAPAPDGTGEPPAPPTRREVALERPLREAYVALAWAGPRVREGGGSEEDDVYATEVLTAVLGQGRASRLYQGLREGRGLVSVVSASYYLQHDAGVVLVTARTAPERRERVADAVVDEVRRLVEGGIEDAELERAVTAIEASHAFGYETAEGVAYAYGLADTVWTLDFELTFLDRVRRVTPARVRDAAARYLRPGGMTVATLGPDP